MSVDPLPYILARLKIAAENDWAWSLTPVEARREPPASAGCECPLPGRELGELLGTCPCVSRVVVRESGLVGAPTWLLLLLPPPLPRRT